MYIELAAAKNEKCTLWILFKKKYYTSRTQFVIVHISVVCRWLTSFLALLCIC